MEQWYACPNKLSTVIHDIKNSDTDQLKSTMHRVTLPPLSDRFEGKERMTRARYSIPYFVSPDGDSVVECLPVCMSEERPAKYEATKWDEYRKMRAALQYRRSD